MATVRLTISVQGDLVARVDELVRRRVFRDRSRAIEAMVRQQLDRLEHAETADASPETEMFGAEAYKEGYGALHAGDWQDIEG